MKTLESIIEKIIFHSRWIQAPIYVGLVVAAGLYTYKFVYHLIHLVIDVQIMGDEELMLGILDLVDVSMVINLLIVVIIGGYWTFVSKIELLENHRDKPDWLSKVNASTLKIKLIIALISISGVQLLKIFVDIENYSTIQIVSKTGIHMVFVFSALLMALTDKIIHSNEEHEAKEEKHGH